MVAKGEGDGEGDGDGEVISVVASCNDFFAKLKKIVQRGFENVLVWYSGNGNVIGF